MDSSLMIFDIQRFSVNDGPGIRTTVFLKGCPMSCFWCHNPESQTSGPELMYYANKCVFCELCSEACLAGAISFNRDETPPERSFSGKKCNLCSECVKACPTNALSIVGEKIKKEKLIEILLADKDYFTNSGGGVTFSGGEPLLQAENLRPVMQALHEATIHIAIDTAGCVPFADFESIIELTDMFLYDLKTLNPQKHIAGTGIDNRQILDNLTRIIKTGTDVVIRYPVIPAYNDTVADIEQIATYMRQAGLKRLDILPYHDYGKSKYKALGRDYPAVNAAASSDEHLFLLKKIAEKQHIDVRIEVH